ncbi:PREDICTED: LOB domain-containing protein 16 [Tarenaya hassleriana]|uniref:LOB domain-containing protein 16 n=1 Tax=Tarenaya hassleriana TaxID=28532 RepID=UPI00053C6E43|nr:PREDICTED: LOB domain-containing protein 16 [Tarenaya hassleriana]
MASSSTGTGSPCGACKFLRRKCASDCIFAPYFSSDQGPARFAAIHRVFGASNVSKLLHSVPVHDRCEAVVSIAYEAQARLSDPVYGCVAHIFALQQQVAFLQAQLMQLKAQLISHNNIATSTTNISETQHLWQLASGFPTGTTPPYTRHGHVNPSTVSPQSSLESFDQSNTSSDVTNVQEIQSRGHDGLGFHEGYPNKKRLVTQCNNNDLSELQALARRMMRN